MKKFVNNFILACGLLLTLAAFPVFAQEAEVTLNKKPLQDFANFVNDKIQKKEVDLNAPFSVEINTVLTQERKFDVEKTKVGAKTGDEEMIKVFLDGIGAVNDGGFFVYLQNFGTENLLIKSKQDDKTLTVEFISELASSARANSVGNSLKLMISMGKEIVKSEDEKALLKSASLTIDNKKIILNFAMPKEIYQEMVSRKLKENEAKKQKQGAGNN